MGCTSCGGGGGKMAAKQSKTPNWGGMKKSGAARKNGASGNFGSPKVKMSFGKRKDGY